MASLTSCPSETPVTPLAVTSRVPGCDSGSAGDGGVEAVGGMGLVLCACRLSAHAGRPAVRHKGRGFAGRRVNRLCRFNITGVIQNAQAARGLPRALRITMLCPAPACGLVRRGRACLLMWGRLAPPPHPRCGAARLRLAAFNLPPPALRSAAPGFSPAGFRSRARSPHPSAPRGSPQSKRKRSPLGRGCRIKPSCNPCG